MKDNGILRVTKEDLKRAEKKLKNKKFSEGSSRIKSKCIKEDNYENLTEGNTCLKKDSERG